MLLLSADELIEISYAIFSQLGTPTDISRRVAEIVVGADLAGQYAHGVYRIPEYVAAIKNKRVVVTERPHIDFETPATARMDAKFGWGHYAVDQAMRLAISKAKSTGIGSIAINHCAHIGRLGEYVEQATVSGCIGMVFLGYFGRQVGCCMPFGGKENLLLTNPIAIGVPTSSGIPFLLDYATSAGSRGKMNRARLIAVQQHKEIVEIGDSEHALLRFNDHKLYALSLAMCLLGGLSGGGFRNKSTGEHEALGGVWLQAIDINAFQDCDGYVESIQQVLAAIRNSGPEDDSSPVQVPGDPEQRARVKQTKHGLEIPAVVVDSLRKVVEENEMRLPGHFNFS